MDNYICTIDFFGKFLGLEYASLQPLDRYVLWMIVFTGSPR